MEGKERGEKFSINCLWWNQDHEDNLQRYLTILKRKGLYIDQKTHIEHFMLWKECLHLWLNNLNLHDFISQGN